MRRVLDSRSRSSPALMWQSNQLGSLQSEWIVYAIIRIYKATLSMAFALDEECAWLDELDFDSSQDFVASQPRQVVEAQRASRRGIRRFPLVLVRQRLQWSADDR